MPKMMPKGNTASWPADEGTLGVVGVAPWATLEFCRCFYSLIKAEKDWHYPRVLLDVNTKLPSRGRHLQLGEEDPSPYIAETIKELAAAGATVAVVACNTAHIMFDRWSADSPIPVIHIVDAAVEQACNAGARDVLALTSASLAENGMYGKKAEAAGLSFHRLSNESQAIVNDLIDQVKLGGALSPVGHRAFCQLLNCFSVRKVDTVFLGCTELSILATGLQGIGLRVVDSNLALARAACLAIQK